MGRACDALREGEALEQERDVDTRQHLNAELQDGREQGARTRAVLARGGGVAESWQ